MRLLQIHNSVNLKPSATPILLNLDLQFDEETIAESKEYQWVVGKRILDGFVEFEDG